MAHPLVQQPRADRAPQGRPAALRLPREVADGIRPHAGSLARAMVTVVAREVSEYTEPLAGPLGPITATATQAVILRELDSLVDPRAARENWTGLARAIGEAEYTSGRSLDALKTAYQVAERTLAQQLSVAIRRSGVSLDLARHCVETVGTLVHDLAAGSIRAYMKAHARGRSLSDRSRTELFRIAVAEAPSDPEALVTAAREARWRIPETVQAVVLRPPDGEQEPPADVRLGDSVLVGIDRGEPCLVTPAGDEVIADLAQRFPGWRISVGPEAPLAEVRTSLRVARRALDLHDRGLVPDDQVVDCTRHRLALMLFADDWLVDRLVERCLAPLDGMTERQQERLLITLHAWLSTRGQANEIAEILGVHPQTVRYRVKKLEDVFGDQLDRSDARFELALAARAALAERRHPAREALHVT